jgi:phosphatidylserine/phosphatidylglycerophosphate/cardiolipin synthase-like enzyme
MGSANFTPEAITTQANLLHVFDSAELARLYQDRHDLLAGTPELSIGDTAKDASWSSPIKVGKASIRVFFSPEPAGSRLSIDTVVQAVQAAKSSVMFCMFDPTDQALLNAFLDAGDKGKLLYGMLNKISDPTQTGAQQRAMSSSGEPPMQPSPATEIQVTLFNRSRRDRKILAYSYFRPGSSPAGFLPELSAIDTSRYSTFAPTPGKKAPPAVHIHHKFIVIDGETADPTIYTGSANLSENSTHKNDENLLEIRGSAALADVYVAEFMRLYQHYRARALWNMAHQGPPGAAAEQPKSDLPSFALRPNNSWTKDAYTAGSPGYLERTTLATPRVRGGGGTGQA